MEESKNQTTKKNQNVTMALKSHLRIVEVEEKSKKLILQNVKFSLKKISFIVGIVRSLFVLFVRWMIIRIIKQ